MKIEFEVDARLVVVASLTGFCGLFALHAAYLEGFMKYWPQSSQDLAAWAQAVGSVAAIVGSVWSTKYQIRRAKDVAVLEEKQRNFHLGCSALHVVARAHRLVKNAAPAFRDWSRYGAFLAPTDVKFENSILSADIVLAKDLDAEILKNLLDARSCMSIAANAIEMKRKKNTVESTLAPDDFFRAKRGLVYARWKIRGCVKKSAREIEVLRT